MLAVTSPWPIKTMGCKIETFVLHPTDKKDMDVFEISSLFRASAAEASLAESFIAQSLLAIRVAF